MECNLHSSYPAFFDEREIIMVKKSDFINGKILSELLKFAAPVLFALFLQAMYGAVDLFVVGKFATSADVSAVSVGSQIMMTLTNLISSLAMGTTIYLGQKLGEGKAKEGGAIIGSSVCLFIVIGLLFSLLIPVGAVKIASVMNAPKAAFSLTTSYIRICGAGSVIVVIYNLIGSIFRGMGDSKTPLITVFIACICNILGDLIFVAGFGMGTRGAAIATILAQAISVIISLKLISKKKLPFTFSRKNICMNFAINKKVLLLGIPIALQDFLVGISFLVILAIVNQLGLIASAGVGVAEKVCAFIMLIPSAFMQSMAAFAAQNHGAGRYDRAKKSLLYAFGVSIICAVIMFYLAYFHGDMLSLIFANDSEVVLASADYLKAYAIDCLLTCFLFCFIGFFNGMGYTGFVMIQGIVGAFAIRIPVSYIMSRWEPVSLFHIGLATPCSTFIQIILCVICFIVVNKKTRKIYQKT